MREMIFRKATLADLPEMKQLYVETIHEVCKNDYSAAERSQWAASVNDHARWADVVQTQYVVLTEIRRQLVGYGTLKNGNYIDFFYVHTDFQRQGIAQSLLELLQTEALKQGATLLFSDVSITARPFFKKNGFVVVAQQKNLRGNEMLINFRMQKQLR